MLSQFKPIHFILLIGLVLRLLNWHQQSANNPIFNLPIVDAKEYVNDATFYNETNWLGTFRFQLKEYKKAKETWEKGLKLSPDNKAILLNIEHAREQVSNWEDI